MSNPYDDEKDVLPNTEEQKTNGEEQYSLNDDRRVKTLSPGALVAKRFFRNRVAVAGLIILAFMFIFSFLGGVLSPYSEDQLFYRYDHQNKQFAGVIENTEFRYVSAGSDVFPTIAQSQFLLAKNQGKSEFTVKDRSYTIEILDETKGDEFYAIFTDKGKTLAALAGKMIVSSSQSNAKIDINVQYEILKALKDGGGSFTYEGVNYTVDDEGGVNADGKDYAYASKYIVNAIMADVFLTRQFKEELIESIQTGDDKFSFTDANGQTAEYTVSFNARTNGWDVLQSVETKVFDSYHVPSKEHWLGTDKNGMDMLTRLMYGGRVSLYIGFIVVIIETVIGVILGGIAGYFGGFVDGLVMRIVDIFYCIPSMPILLILGAAMDALRVDPQIRMIYLMLILGILGWAGIARLVRGQILSLREQEFMTATEATGIRTSRRIFRHLIPNVIPQLIVTMTMSLGSTILIEATLSFLGLGVKFPFASWGNIITDVNDTYVLSNYWFIWIPAGVLLVATILAFNLVGDGLRDAFDPRMKR